ncbi:Putative, 10TM heavy-metal exporter [Vibrio xiamenensis]|uniref:Putative, 10TM heavy-metal exporter n=1 Tax=Vibrio xiamenensis TaxID=861298 RepID=A0A1G7WMZ0_9VIBR|nr:putative manganese transporter [Vibrio xiamenensis]SDG73254.1 Putative, 10TM heavy-metal exporter [Vibrio xiamenensis]
MDALKLSRSLPPWLCVSQFKLAHKRLLLPVALLALLAAPITRDVTVNTLSDAFWAVSSYVAFTLALYHYIALFFTKRNAAVELYLNSRHYQVVFAALLGALPGCGGAIIVTTQFVSGKVGFGAIVAVLTATMGDAAFLLLASKPSVGLGVIALGVIVGCISGWVVNIIHSDDFMRPSHSSLPERCTGEDSSPVESRAINLQGRFWKWLIIPATIIAFLGSFQIDINQLLSLPEMSIEWIGCICIITSMLLWSLTKEIKNYQSTVSEDDKPVASHPLQRAAQDTNFVTAWVIIAFMLFELTRHFGHLDMGNMFNGLGVWMPLMGVVVGLLPGCGPQILVTSFYLTGAAPMSAQLANAISNDGDALFPAIAMAPKAALVATIYTSIPALIVGYSYYALFEM